MEKSTYYRIVCRCREIDGELVAHNLFEIGTKGIEEKEGGEGILLLHADFFDVTVEEMQERLIVFNTNIEKAKLQEVNTTLEEKVWENWQDNWKDNFKPLEVGESLIILPPWEENKTKRKGIIINPGMGFGTGYHESTRLAILGLEWIFHHYKVEDIIDVGTGSGILSIAAAHLGATSITGIDLEAEAIEEASENLHLSGFGEMPITLLTESAKGQRKLFASLTIANIVAETLLDLREELTNFVKAGGTLLLSGILDSKADSVRQMFSYSLNFVHEIEMGEWRCQIFEKPNATCHCWAV